MNARRTGVRGSEAGRRSPLSVCVAREAAGFPVICVRYTVGNRENGNNESWFKLRVRLCLGELVVLVQHEFEVVLIHHAGILYPMEIVQHERRLLSIQSVGVEGGCIELGLNPAAFL